MQDTDPEFIKEREIHFTENRPGEDQAAAAAELLRGIDGVDSVEVSASGRLRLQYDLRRISLEVIEDALAELGFGLDEGLMARVQRALVYYSEETQRANLDVEYSWAPRTREAFVKAYQRRPHGCRDGRPPHWRRYL